MLPISRCNTVGARLLLGLTLLVVTGMALTPETGVVQQSVNDKLAHPTAFFVLAFLTHASWPELKFSWRQITPLLGYGLAIEIIQHFIPNRDFSLLDIAVDIVGIGLYMLLIPLIRHLLRTFANDASSMPKSIQR
jgi:VanZ family protein